MSSPPNIPYQAYKSKKHSRTSSNVFAPNLSPPLSRPSSVIGNGNALNGAVQLPVSDRHTERRSMDSHRGGSSAPVPVPVEPRPNSAPPNGALVTASPVLVPVPAKENGAPPVPVDKPSSSSIQSTSPIPIPAPVQDQDQSPAASKGEDGHGIVVQAPAPVRGHVQAVPSISSGLNGKTEVEVEGSVEPVAGPSTASTSTPATASTSTVPAVTPTPIPRKTSSFRHVPLRGSAIRSPLRSSPLRPAGTHSRTTSTSSTTSTSTPRQFEQPVHAPTSTPTPTPNRSVSVSSQTQGQRQPRSRITSLASVNSTISSVSDDRPLPTIPSSSHEPGYPERAATAPEPQLASSEVLVPPPRTHSLLASPRVLPKPRPQSYSHSPSPASTSAAPSPSPASSPAPTPTPHLPLTHPNSTCTPAPYRPGFQPKGVYRPLTEEFTAQRKTHRDVGRIERTKLERRLEKLIQLHFPSSSSSDSGGGVGAGVGKRVGGGGGGGQNRRASSFFDLDLSDLRNMDAGELWRGVIQSQAVQGSKADIRAAEQRITPWQDDAFVSKCPICTASFHPLTNRKHHCRLCGKIICSLPVKRPQRPETCSLLFVVDPKTRRIEEVGEGVDYGVRKRRSSTVGAGKGKEKEEPLPEEEKFLKGVRICRQCRHVLLRQQHLQEVAHIPTFVRLYEVFISLEKEIEDSLPQFQELILTLSHDDQPTKEASAARKRLLEAFAQYDALAKRIRKLACPGGKGSSEDRVQLAILSRANLFLQKNMFPLQSLPKPKLSKAAKSSSPDDGTVIDPDSAVAHALQPLLEQEALLESFVEEARAHRKFQDAKTLKANLQEIRAEIDKIMANADGSMGQPSGKASAGRK